MTELRVRKVVAALPGTLAPSTIYFVRAGAGFDMYVTNEVGLVTAYKPNLPVPAATTAEFRNATAARLLSSDIYWAAQVPVALTDAGTIAVNMANGISFAVTLGGNRTLGNPTNAKPGQAGSIFVTGGGYSMAFASNWVPDDLTTFPVLNASGVTELRYRVAEGGKVRISGGKPSAGALRRATYFIDSGGSRTAMHMATEAETVLCRVFGSGSGYVTFSTNTGWNDLTFGTTLGDTSPGNTRTVALAAGQTLRMYNTPAVYIWVQVERIS